MKTRSWLWVTSLVCICGLSGCHNESEGGTETPVETEAVCGDGVLAESEDCDDGNTISGDGCSDDCIQELGYDCASGICQVIAGSENCGNGVVDEGEQCDDGNTVSGDGCLENCLAVEAGWTCPAEGGTCEVKAPVVEPEPDFPENVCGDGIVSVMEQCDDGNVISGDGCSDSCLLEPGWECLNAGSACTEIVVELCGDGKLDADKGETCDDGNKLDDDGCSRYCLIEPGYTCEGTVCVTTCGDGIRAGLEACDDANTMDGDGCKGDCSALEDGFICFDGIDGRTFCASPSCGDRIINSTETCDYGQASNDKNGPSYGWSPEIQGPYCYLCNLTPYCGDGIINGNEQCDQGLLEDGTYLKDASGMPIGGDGSYGGCKTDCTLAEHCGDGILNGNEKCDLGTDENGVSKNVGGYNGCKSDCSGPELFCGDGIVNGNEQCDQGVMDALGNLTGGTGSYNGCLPTCYLASHCGDGILDAQEACDGAPGCTESCVYGPICGDGNVDPGEACDEGMLSPQGRPMIVDGTGRPMGGYGNYGGCMADCTKAPYCGDGKLDAGEICDDGNNSAGDGCAANCHTVEKGWTCETVGNKSVCTLIPCGDGVRAGNEVCDDNEPGVNGGCLNCQPVNGYMCIHGKPACPANICNETDKKCELISVLYGDGVVNSDFENCDDGNTTDGDGCTDGRVDPGYSCLVPGELCIAAACGDGILARGEECDDGNVLANDGCSNRCKKEEGYLCSTPGTPCVKGYCGDNIVQHGEECDDGNASSAGCSSTCMIEPGYVCLAAGGKCFKTECGDGEINAAPDGQQYNGYEQCDDGDSNSGDGCNANCRIETGYHCSQVGGVSVCEKGKCRDGILDAGEECDDGNAEGGDGCDPMCKREPIFECDENGANCKPVCGDGITLWDNGEECDDGNLISGDGCSSVCTREAGFQCTEYSYDYPSTIQLPAVYRDFRAYNSSTCRNMNANVPKDGCIDNSLASTYGGKFSAKNGHPDFERINASEKNIVKTTLGSDGLPVFNKSNNTGITANSFQMWYRDFPGINKTIREPMTLNLIDASSGKYQFDDSSYFPLTGRGYGNDGNSNNYHFTTHIQTYFKYRGNEETLSFRGDDDVWVFVNGIRAIDLGGCHNPEDGSFTLNATTDSNGITSDTTYKLYKGGIYSINFFQAERKTSGSNFKLELAGFLDMGTTMCASVCGDGIVVGGEQCDVGNVSTADKEIYGCINCVKSAVCGNGRIEEGEACDTGHLCKDSSSVACDGIIYVEDTDCINCKYSNCGNGVLDGKEECDCKDNICEGLAAGEVCLDTCRKSKCGDGIVDPNNNETCDLGAGNGPDAACTQLCQPPRCGDGIVSSGEACDDGINDGAYGHCGLGCTYVAPACGDGIIQPEHGEDCDNGAMNNDAVYNGCTTACKFGPRCGDGILHPLEQCDNGDANRDGLYGGCSTACTLNDHCGDGTVQSGEECDNGVANVDPSLNTYNRCTTACELGAYCGDGNIDATEECDLGTAQNTGGYGKGLCNANCTTASYCGDGRIDTANGEACDNGAANEDGLYNGCTTNCQLGPHCGDGIVNGSEACDGGSACTQYCTSVIN